MTVIFGAGPTTILGVSLEDEARAYLHTRRLDRPSTLLPMDVLIAFVCYPLLRV